MAVCWFEIRHFRIGKAGAEFFRLLVHVQDELWPVDPHRKTWKVFDQRCRGKLTAGVTAFEHERIQIRARRIDGRRQTGAAAPGDNHFFHARAT